MRVVVTGGAGFIGANLVRRLLAESSVEQVRVIDDLSTGSLRNLEDVEDAARQGRLVVEVGSILDSELVERCCSGAEAVVHLAARGSVPRSIDDPTGSNDINVNGTLVVLEAVRRTAAARPAHVIFASSSSVYGANPELPKHESMTAMPMSPYAVSKLAGEQYMVAYHHSYGLDVLPFRFFNVFGPVQPAGHVYAAVVPAFVDAAIHGRPLRVNGDGLQSRDFTYVGTVVETIWHALRSRVTSSWPVNLAFGTRTSLVELIGLIEEIVGGPLELEHLPPRPGDVQHSQAANARLRDLFPDVTPTGLRSGLETTIAWHLDAAHRAHA